MILVASNNVELEEKNTSSLSTKTILNMTDNDSQISPEHPLNGLDGEKNKNHISDLCDDSSELEISQICENIISASCDVNGDNHINVSETCNNFETEIGKNLETSTNVETNSETISIEKDIDTPDLAENNSNENSVSENSSNLLTDLELIEDGKLLEKMSVETLDNSDLEKMDVDSENCLLDKNVLHDQKDNDFGQEINSEILDTVKSLSDTVKIEEQTDNTDQISSENLDLSETVPEAVTETMPKTVTETILKTVTEAMPETLASIKNEVSTEEFVKEIPVTPVLENDHMVYIATPDVLKELTDGVSENSSKINDRTDVNDHEILMTLEEDKKSENKNSPEESKSLDDKNKSSIIIDTLDLLLSDDESDPKNNESRKTTVAVSDKTENKNVSLTIDEDDDLLLIEDECKNDDKSQEKTTKNKVDNIGTKEENNSKALVNDTQPIKTADENVDIVESNKTATLTDSVSQLDTNMSISATSPKALLPESTFSKDSSESSMVNEKKEIINTDTCTSDSADNDPIIPLNFMKTFKTSLERMTRDDLEEYCVVKIVETIMKRSDLSKAEAMIKAQMKSNDALRKKIAYMSKQQKDLEVVMKSLCSEHRKRKEEFIEPVKISRSVGFQVGPNFMKNRKVPSLSPMMTKEKNTKSRMNAPKSSSPSPIPINKNVTNLKKSSNFSQKTSNHESKSTKTDQSNSILKNVLSTNFANDNGLTKQNSEKRPLDQSIDLTDDEPPAKQMALNNRPKTTSPNTRLQSPPNTPIGNKIIMLNSTPQHTNSGLQKSNTYRPKNPSNSQGLISLPMIRGNIPSNQNQNIRYGIPIKTVSPSTPQRINNLPVSKHPAPLPNHRNISSATWKSLPPKPELKISKVQNGIVISWTMENGGDKTHNIASYQIFAYQETSAPAHTDLWKKIGDVKALQLPMACTLTQFMAGYKYFFAVRAVDVYSRVGPFSSPGFILLGHDK